MRDPSARNRGERGEKKNKPNESYTTSHRKFCTNFDSEAHLHQYENARERTQGNYQPVAQRLQNA
jgi:ribosomal protein S20